MVRDLRRRGSQGARRNLPLACIRVRALLRSLYGNTPVLLAVERQAAEFFDLEGSFYFASGYLSNAVLLQTLAEEFDVLFLDESAFYLLPGVRRTWAPIRQTPVLRCGDDVVAGSAAIIDYLERRFPEPRLYPRDDATLRRAISVQARFDDEVGPAIRLAMFHDLLLDPAYFASMFTSGQPLLTRVGYRAIFPIVSILMIRQMKITTENAEAARATTRRGLDFVVEECWETGYLAGDSFSVADLAAASLLAPAVEMDPSPFGYPKPFCSRLRVWWDSWREHPGTAWVRSMYERHRGVSREVSAAA